MRINYRIHDDDGRLSATDAAYLVKPPEVGERVRFGSGTVVYDVVSVNKYVEHNDDEGTTDEYADVQLKVAPAHAADVRLPSAGASS